MGSASLRRHAKAGPPLVPRSTIGGPHFAGGSPTPCQFSQPRLEGVTPLRRRVVASLRSARIRAGRPRAQGAAGLLRAGPGLRRGACRGFARAVLFCFPCRQQNRGPPLVWYNVCWRPPLLGGCAAAAALACPRLRVVCPCAGRSGLASGARRPFAWPVLRFLVLPRPGRFGPAMPASGQSAPSGASKKAPAGACVAPAGPGGLLAPVRPLAGASVGLFLAFLGIFEPTA